MKQMRFFNFNNKAQPFYLVAGVILVLLIGFADYILGYELSFSIFYLIPIVFVAWYSGKTLGFIISFMSAGIWLTADLASGHSYSNNIIPVWNALMRLGYFSLVCYLLALRHVELADLKFSIHNQMRFFDNKPQLFYLVAGVILVLLIGFVDYRLGYEFSFSIFYLIPIVFVAWYSGKALGFIISFLSAGIWLIADLASGHSYSNNIIPVWNALMRLGYFSLVCYLMSLLHRDLNDIKSTIYKGAEKTGVTFLARKQRKGCIALFYHGVEKQIANPVVQESHMPLSLFEEQIKYLKKHFEIISMEYLYDSIVNGYAISPKQAVLTFDDGYKNNINMVAPLLTAYNMPFSVFICTRHASDKSRFPAYYLRTAIFYTEQQYVNIPSLKMEFDISNQEKRISAINNIGLIMKKLPQGNINILVNNFVNLLPYDRWLELNSIFSSDEPMDWDEVKKLHELGVTIGSHCHDHSILHPNQSNEEIDYQLKTSKNLIEKHLGECKYFAYPNGGYNDIKPYSIHSVKNNNYLLGFSTVRGEINNRVDKYLLPRLSGYFGYGSNIDVFKFQINTISRFNHRYNEWCHMMLCER